MPDLGDGLGVEGYLQEIEHGVSVRQVDVQLEQETIELSLGQRVCPLELDGVLCSQHPERTRQQMGLPQYSHLSLLHGFQHGRLGLRGCPVDFVHQHHVGKQRTGSELKGSGRVR